MPSAILFTPSVTMISFADKPLSISVKLFEDLPTFTTTFFAIPEVPFTFVAINTNFLS